MHTYMYKISVIMEARRACAVYAVVCSCLFAILQLLFVANVHW
jgi:hypothetical protein